MATSTILPTFKTIEIGSASNLNSILTSGFYWWGQAPTNAPFINGAMIVISNGTPARTTQLIFPRSSGTAKRRYSDGTTWYEVDL